MIRVPATWIEYERAAQALMRSNTDGLPAWSDLSYQEREYWRGQAKVAINGSQFNDECIWSEEHAQTFGKYGCGCRECEP